MDYKASLKDALMRLSREYAYRTAAVAATSSPEQGTLDTAPPVQADSCLRAVFPPSCISTPMATSNHFTICKTLRMMVLTECGRANNTQWGLHLFGRTSLGPFSYTSWLSHPMCPHFTSTKLDMYTWNMEGEGESIKAEICLLRLRQVAKPKCYFNKSQFFVLGNKLWRF